MPSFWAKSLSTLIHFVGHDTQQNKRNPLCSARLIAAASRPRLNDLYKSRADSVCQPANVFLCLHGGGVELSLFICVCHIVCGLYTDMAIGVSTLTPLTPKLCS